MLQHQRAARVIVESLGKHHADFDILYSAACRIKFNGNADSGICAKAWEFFR